MTTSDSSQTDGRPELRIQLLGNFGVCVGTQVITRPAWRLRKAAAIVKLLVLAPNHQLYHEQIADVLWPDLEPQAAANNLRHAPHIARHILEPARFPGSDNRYLQGDPLVLCPEGTVWVDAEAFEAAAAAARRAQDPAAYRAAIVLYTGDLLPEDRYEDWTMGRREDLLRVYLALLIELAWLYEVQDQFELAIEILQRAVSVEPTHQDAHVGLMRLYSRSARRYQALQQYRLYQDLLSHELDVEIDPQVRQSYLDILSSHFPTAGPSNAGLALTELSQAVTPFIHRHNLPAPVTTFVGREREVGEVSRLLRQARLLTLVGPGGCGKTRLALEVALRLVTDYPDGVWLIELAALTDPELVPDAVAATLGLHKQLGHPLTAMLATALETKHLLLILDNCEHLVDACATLAHSLLLGCPHLRILATSRQALGIAGEQVWRVPSLGLPEGSGSLSADQVARSEAVRLFLDRAQAAHPGFVLVDMDLGAVAEICWRVDGIPLAIELAAARMRLLSVKQIAALLDDRFRLLTGGSRTALPRQQTLQATVDWSYHLLGEAEQLLFERLSVFAVACLDHPAACYATLELGGPETLGPLQVVCIFEEVDGKRFEVEHVPEKALEEQQKGAADPMQRSFVGLMRCYARGDAIDHLLLRPDFHVVFVWRRNLLQTVVSNLIAEQTDLWKKWDMTRSLESYYDRLHPLDLGDVRTRVEWLSWHMPLCESILDRRADGRVFKIVYEDFYFAPRKEQAEFVEAMWRFLDVEPIPVTDLEYYLRPELTKLNSPATYRFLPNAQEVNDLCGSDRYGWLFESDGLGVAV